MKHMTQSNFHPEITVANGHAVTTSRNVAKAFGKEHYHVMRDIERLECSKEFNASNFGVITYTDARNRQQREYQITRDGFTFLAMGFTGKDAARFKEAYIEAFNQMERALHGDVSAIADVVPRAQFDALLAELLRVNPRIAKLLQCRRAGLTQKETGNVLGVSKDTVRHMENSLSAAGLVDYRKCDGLPQALGELQ